MTNVTGLPSGQRLFCALQIFIRSGSVMVLSEFDLLAIKARSRAEASETVARIKMNMRKSRRSSTLISAKQKSLGIIVREAAVMIKGN